MPRKEDLGVLFLTLLGGALASCSPTPEKEKISPIETKPATSIIESSTTVPLKTLSPTLFPSFTPTFLPFLTPTGTPFLTQELTTSTPEAQTITQFLLRELINENIKRTASQRQINPVEYDKRIDKDLNAKRLNILFWGSGISHEPPFDKLPIASPLIISIDLAQNKIDTVSITHDVWVPLIDRTLGIFGQANSANRLDQAILNKEAGAKFGGQFALSQRVIENATGLAINFQIHLDDQVIKNFVDQVAGGSLVVDVPIDMPLDAYYMEDGIHYPQGWLVPHGLIRLNANDVVGYIKDVPTVSPGQKDTKGNSLYDPRMEHSARRTAVIKGILNYAQNHLLDLGFTFRLTSFLKSLNNNPDQFSTNFDFQSLCLNSISTMATNLVSLGNTSLELPGFRHSPYAVDPCCTTDPNPLDEPLRWVDVAILNGNKSVRIARDTHILKSGLSYEVPLGADPFNPDDLVYFQSVRDWVKKNLLR